MDKAKERPGVIFYFDMWEPLLELPDKSLSDILRASVRYAKTGEIPENLDNNDKVFFSIIRPKIDRDADHYEHSRIQRQYAVYCRETRRRGGEPLSFEDWFSVKNDGC